ncbi:hypothetical protein AAVH_28886, partial [Aphelenchoides avenae]
MIVIGVDFIHHAVDTSVHTVALLLNFILLYLILRHSQFQVKLYKTVILVVLFEGNSGYTLAMPNGFFAGFNWAFDYVSVTMVPTFIHSNMVVLVMQFYYRYRFVCRIEDRRKIVMVAKTIVFPAIWCVMFAGITFWFMYETPEFTPNFGLEVLRNKSWPYDESRPPFVFGCFMDDARSYAYVGQFMVTMSVGYGLILWCEYKMIRYFRSLGVASSEMTRQLHSEIHKALIALAVAPFFTNVFPVYYFMFSVLSRSNTGVFSAFMVPMCASITLVNPLTSAYFVKSYRYAILDALGLRKPVV